MQTQQKKLKLLLPVFLLILGSIAIVPAQQLLAQSCNAGEIVHVVARGENLFRIGLRYGVSYQDIAIRNRIADSSRIYAGMSLCIPSGGAAPDLNRVVPPLYVPSQNPEPRAQMIADTTTTTTTVTAGQENWCSNGGPWDDGRCIVAGDEALTNYWFFAGWCNAQVQLGNYVGSVDDCLNAEGYLDLNHSSSSSSSSSTTSSEPDIIATITASVVSTTSFDYDLVDRDDDEEFACTIVYDKYTGVVLSLAEWEDDYDDQDQVVWFTALPGLYNYAVNIDDDAEEAGVIKTTDPYKTFSRASASILLRDDGESVGTIGPVDCERITNE